jgi:nucleotidyltransferase/DNA polymerase involved in DNA repair
MPDLRDRPLLLWATRGRAAVVVAADPAHLAGLSLARARALAPDAACLPADPVADERLLDVTCQALDIFSPRIMRIKERSGTLIFCDLGRVPEGHLLALAERLATVTYAACGLRPAVGAGPTAVVARLAALAAPPAGALVVHAGAVARFLPPLPIVLLPIDRELAERLRWFGLVTLGALAKLSRPALLQQFGAQGELLYALARGSDPPPGRIAPTPLLPCLRIGWRFAGAVADRHMLDEALERVVARLVLRLESGGWSARSLTLILEYDQGYVAATRRLAQPTAGDRLLRRAFAFLLDACHVTEPVVCLRVEVEPVACEVRQATMFVDQVGADEAFDDLVARLAPRHGAALLRADLVDPGAPCLERQFGIAAWPREDAP